MRLTDWTTGEPVEREYNIDPKVMAQAIRLVETTRANVDGVPFGGPEPQWYDLYAEDIITQYELLMREGK